MMAHELPTATLLEECAENMSFRVDKAWRQRCSQRFRNILVASLAMHCAEITESADA